MSSTTGYQSINKVVHPQLYKTEMCRHFVRAGECWYGEHCTFAHGAHELRSATQNISEGVTTEGQIRRLQADSRTAAHSSSSLAVGLPHNPSFSFSCADSSSHRPSFQDISCAASSMRDTPPINPAAFPRYPGPSFCGCAECAALGTNYADYDNYYEDSRHNDGARAVSTPDHPSSSLAMALPRKPSFSSSFTSQDISSAASSMSDIPPINPAAFPRYPEPSFCRCAECAGLEITVNNSDNYENSRHDGVLDAPAMVYEQDPYEHVYEEAGMYANGETDPYYAYGQLHDHYRTGEMYVCDCVCCRPSPASCYLQYH